MQRQITVHLFRTHSISSAVARQTASKVLSGSDTERYEYLCPCGNGRIIEEHDNIPGFRDHDVWISCVVCAEKYKLDTSKGVRGWELVETQ